MRVSGWRVAADGRNRGAPTRPPSLPQALRSGAALSANADRLQVCQVETVDGVKEIVCGAPNARAGLTTIDVMEEDRLLDNATAMGNLIMDGIRREMAGDPGLIEVRGNGLMIGIELDRPCAEIVGKALKAGTAVMVIVPTATVAPEVITALRAAPGILDVAVLTAS
jgi:acetylornithine aminotransferase